MSAAKPGDVDGGSRPRRRGGRSRRGRVRRGIGDGRHGRRGHRRLAPLTGGRRTPGLGPRHAPRPPRPRRRSCPRRGRTRSSRRRCPGSTCRRASRTRSRPGRPRAPRPWREVALAILPSGNVEGGARRRREPQEDALGPERECRSVVLQQVERPADRDRRSGRRAGRQRLVERRDGVAALGRDAPDAGQDEAQRHQNAMLIGRRWRMAVLHGLDGAVSSSIHRRPRPGSRRHPRARSAGAPGSPQAASA